MTMAMVGIRPMTTAERDQQIELDQRNNGEQEEEAEEHRDSIDQEILNFEF